MRMNLETRLRKLEGVASTDTLAPCHSVIGDSTGDCEAQKWELIEAGQANESDEFISIVIVDAPVKPDDCRGWRPSAQLA
jgi:hypothetical protein